MAIQAISSVTNKGYSNISFGKRGEKPVKNHNVTSPMKAVPLAVLIAMSPLTTTNAENIMRAENNANTIELAQNPQSRVLMYAEGFTSQNGTKVAVMAFNTKGGTDSFDQILLKAGEFTFEAKDLVDREIYLYTGNKGKEGPLTYKEVIAETEIEGKKERFSFLDPNIVNYVEAIVSQPTNQSNLQGVRKAHNNLIIANSKGDLLFVDDKYLNQVFLPAMKKAFEISSSGDEIINRKMKEQLNAQELKNIEVEGLYGNYKLRFYDIDGNKDNYEHIYIQNDSGKEFLITGINQIDGRLHGVDKMLSMGQIYAILSQPNIMAAAAGETPYIMTDDILAKEIVDAMSSPEYNKDKGTISITSKTSNLALGDE